MIIDPSTVEVGQDLLRSQYTEISFRGGEANDLDLAPYEMGKTLVHSVHSTLPFWCRILLLLTLIQVLRQVSRPLVSAPLGIRR